MKYRHGDLALISIKKLPDGLKKSDSKTLMTGSNNNPHFYNIGDFYPKNVDEFVFGYFVAFDETELYHRDHGEKIQGKRLRVAKIEPGIYELRKQQEDTHEGMKPIID